MGVARTEVPCTNGAPDGVSQPDELMGGEDCVWLGPISGTRGKSEDRVCFVGHHDDFRT